MNQLNAALRTYRIEKVNLSQGIFLLGIFAKQFYILPSGSFQLGDLLMIVGCMMSFICGGGLRIKKEDTYLLIFVILLSIINVIYAFIFDDRQFITPNVQYVYNLIILFTFTKYCNGINSKSFLRNMSLILKLSMLTQVLVLLVGYGRWYSTSARYMGTFNDPNQYGVFIFFSMLMIFVIDTIMQDKRSWLLFCIICSLLIIQSMSTGTMLGLTFFWGGLYYHKLRKVEGSEKILWILPLVFLGIVLVLLVLGKDFLPSFITENGMYIRVDEKISKILNSQNGSALLADRGWTRIVEKPEYFLYGAGEGNYARFNTHLEIHSSFIGPLFYYGIIPCGFFFLWIYKKIHHSPYVFVYLSMFAEALFLVNYRQPFFWMLIALGSVEMSGIKKKSFL